MRELKSVADACRCVNASQMGRNERRRRDTNLELGYGRWSRKMRLWVPNFSAALLSLSVCSRGWNRVRTRWPPCWQNLSASPRKIHLEEIIKLARPCWSAKYVTQA